MSHSVSNLTQQPAPQPQLKQKPQPQLQNKTPAQFGAALSILAAGTGGLVEHPEQRGWVAEARPLRALRALRFLIGIWRGRTVTQQKEESKGEHFVVMP